ncbi:MAG: Stk1 family PASTA domain-containing Ser/Thr kinase [Actinomycetota bacterium]
MSKYMDDQVLAGRYEISQRLGLGGMAEVFLGKDRALGRPVAVKTLLPQFAHDPSFIARFRREATSAASLNHPNIVSVYDSGSEDSRHFIVMEYVDGHTLKDVIREEGPLLPERAAEIAAEVCSALQFAHSHGIVHRDVKPANIMINSRGEVKVADFGIARAASGESVTQTATVLGTAQYFSPEQAQASHVDARSDLYSLGVVMYEMLTRQVPFSGASPVAIAYKHVKEDPIPPSRLNADVPASIEAVVMKSLSKNPDNRYQSAQEMRQDIERAIRGLPVNAPRVMTPAEQTAVISSMGAGDDTVMLRRIQTTRTTAQPLPRRRGAGIALLALIALGMIAIIIWALVSLLPKTTSTVAVPSVIGLTVPDAQKTLTKAGFKTTLGQAEPSATVPPGKVVRTDPIAGTKLPSNASVVIIPSAGKSKVSVPVLVGLSRADAQAAIAKAGLVLGQVNQRTSSSKPKDTVIEQSVKPGTQVDSGTQVDITVSSGQDTAVVPDERGKTEAQATKDLTSRGFAVNVVKQAPGPKCNVAPGLVCHQNPAPGTTLNKNSEVVIFVASEPPPPPPPSSPSPTPSTSPTPSPTGTVSPS